MTGTELAAIHAVPRVAVKATACERAQITLDIVREMPPRPLVVICSAGQTHPFPSRHSAHIAVLTVAGRASAGCGSQPWSAALGALTAALLRRRGLECQRAGVNAVPQARSGGPVIEHMA